jgi:Protein of unknown function (DUF2480)
MIENKVASSGLITLNLEDYLPDRSIVSFDLKDYLFMGLILKEKDYRETLKNKDWEEYLDQNVAVTCSADAIIPVWAYMLAVSYLQPIARDVYMGTTEEMQKHLLLKNIDAIKTEDFADQRIVIKGCGDRPIDNAAFAEITKVLLPVVKSIMYGEPCSTVPIFKKK